MTPLEAARRLRAPTYTSETLDDGYQEFCHECNQRITEHAPDCPWLAMGAIVAALTLAERLVGVWREMGERRRRREAAAWPEVASLPRAADLADDEAAARAALVAALTDGDGRVPTGALETDPLTGTTD